MSDNNSETSQSAASGPAAAAGATPLRLRHRLPKALPNIATLNAISRGHRVPGSEAPASTPAAATADKVAPSPLTTVENAATLASEAAKPAAAADTTAAKLRKPLSSTTNSSEPSAPPTPTPAPATPSLLHASNPSSPAVFSHHPSPAGLKGHSSDSTHLHVPGHPLSSPSIVSSSPAAAALSYKQYANIHGFNSVPMSPASNLGPCTPGPIMPASVYNAKFSNEHIMNIIKHKTLQKLKKIESDSLKERRRRYQRESALFKTRPQLINTNSNSSMSSGGGEGASLTEAPSPSTIDRSKLRMRDLLYYSPRIKRKERSDSNEIILETLTDQPVIPASNISQSSSSSSLSDRRLSTEQQQQQPPAKPTFSAPQLKLAEDGSLILNEESLLIHRIETEPVYDSTVIENEQNDNLSYNSYRKFHHTKKWSQRETAKFYKALSMIGTDFTMIQRLFSNRSRDEIKRKFKREEKLNQAFIDKILSKTSQIDLSVFVPSGSEDEEPRARKSKEAPQTQAEAGEETGEEPKTVKKKHDRYNLKRVKKRAFVESESDSEEKKSTRKDFTSGEFDPTATPSADATKPKTSMKKTQRAPKAVKKVSFASGSPEESALRESPELVVESESRDISDTINNVIQTFCHNESSLSQHEDSHSDSNPAPVEAVAESAPAPSSPVEPAPTDNLPATPVAAAAAADTNKPMEPRMNVHVEQPNEAKSQETRAAATEAGEPKDEDVIDLIFDVDNDLVQEINENPVAKPSQKKKDDDNDETVILDLDNNTIKVVKDPVIDVAAEKSDQESRRPGHSSITITRRKKNTPPPSRPRPS